MSSIFSTVKTKFKSSLILTLYTEPYQCSASRKIRCPLNPNGCEKSSSTVTFIFPPQPVTRDCKLSAPPTGAEVEIKVEASFTAEMPAKYRAKLLCACLRVGFGFVVSGIDKEDEPLA